MKKKKTIRSKIYKGRGKTRVKCKTRSIRKNINRITRKRRYHGGGPLWNNFKDRLRFRSNKVQPELSLSMQSDQQQQQQIVVETFKQRQSKYLKYQKNFKRLHDYMLIKNIKEILEEITTEKSLNNKKYNDNEIREFLTKINNNFKFLYETDEYTNYDKKEVFSQDNQPCKFYIYIMSRFTEDDKYLRDEKIIEDGISKDASRFEM